MAYQTVSDYIVEASELLQDNDMVRYPQARYIQAMNAGLAEAYRLRPDFYRGMENPPAYTVGNLLDDVNFPRQYALPLVLYIVGHLELSDAQGNEDARAATLMTAFGSKLRGAV